MRNRGPFSTIAASPTMVGAVTTLIVIVAVFLAYNANAGLPFVPVYRVSVEIPDAARLTDNNEVRIGGHRVGVVESIDAVRPAEAGQTAQATGTNAAVGGTGGVVARLNLKLDKYAEPLPKDSVFRVRYRSSFGLKYLEIVRGEGDPAPEGFVFNGLDDETDRATACYLPGDPRFASTASARRRLLRAADRVRPDQQHLRRADADERAHQPLGLRRRVRRARDLAQRRDQQPRAPVQRPAAGHEGAPAAATRSCAASSPSSATPPGSSPRSPSSRPTSSPRARSPSPRSPPTRTRSRRRSPRARRRSQTGIRPAAARAPVPRRLRDPQRGAAPRRQRPARDAAGAQRRDRRRHPGAAPLDRHQPQARGRAAPARPPRDPADDRRDAPAPEGDVRRGQAAGQVGRARRRPSATT